MKSFYKKLSYIHSWEEFVSVTETLREKEKGDIFEILTKLILTTKPEYILTLKNVWILQDGIPKEIREKLNIPISDEGIDLIAETFNGEFWAIQCKFKSQNQSPTYKELSTFGNLANNYCRNISLALLVHTGEKGVKKRKLLGENYSEIGLEFWLGMRSEDWERIHSKIKGKLVRPTVKVPRPHQEKAISNAYEHFIINKKQRGRLIMPCGTGKSLTAFWIANKLGVKSVIVAVPSLALIKQSLEDWTREFVAKNENPKPEWLVICSDESTANLDKDEFVADAHSLGIPTTTNVERIIAFLNETVEEKRVIFTTYQSSEKLSEAAKRSKFSFDLAILDEAHKTVGIKSKTFANLLSDSNIAISKRIFMTATERVIRGRKEEVYSMDDTTIYGEQFYQLTFKEAIFSLPPIICDYKILTIMVSNEEIKQLIEKNKFVTDIQEKIEEQQAQSLASAIALRKATQKYNIKHAISFHRSIKCAEDFTKLNQTLNSSNIDNIQLCSSHISSKKSAGERSRLLNDFAHEHLALMSNARCLTEGVDVPAIDCVLFADPKQSIVDIVQAAGRAMRPCEGKNCGYIMLPLVVPDGFSFEEFTESTPFKEVARIISALSTQDEGIAEEFQSINKGKGYVGGQKIILEGTIPVGMKLDITSFVDKINTKIWERVARANWLPFKEAREFARSLNLKGSRDWEIFLQTGKRPPNIPAVPAKIYAGKGWKGYSDWVGTNRSRKNENYLPYEEARDFVHKLKLKGKNDWLSYLRNNKKPLNIPAKPDRIYKDKGWISLGDWLGTRNRKYSEINYRSFEDARAFVHSLKLKNFKEWKSYRRSDKKPIDIPSGPERMYAGKGWKGIGDWLGTGSIFTGIKGRSKFIPFDEAKSYIQTLNIKNKEEWEEYCKSGHKPIYIPKNPQVSYEGKGWIGFEDWLGT